MVDVIDFVNEKSGNNVYTYLKGVEGLHDAHIYLFIRKPYLIIMPLVARLIVPSWYSFAWERGSTEI